MYKVVYTKPSSPDPVFNYNSSAQNLDILQYAAQEQTPHKNVIKQNKEKKPKLLLGSQGCTTEDSRAIFVLEKNSNGFQIQGAVLSKPYYLYGTMVLQYRWVL